jgi:hypothetical protein
MIIRKKGKAKFPIIKYIPVYPLALFFFLLGNPSRLRPESEFFFRAHGAYQIPDQSHLLGSGFDLNAALDWRFFRFFGASLNGGYSLLPVQSGETMSILRAELGPVFVWRPLSRFSMGAELSGGLYSASYGEEKLSGLSFGGRLSAAWHLSPALALTGYGGFQHYASSPQPLLNSFSAGIGVSINLTELTQNEVRIKAEKTGQKQVFPVSYAWYNTNDFATVRISNNEPVEIKRVNVYFHLEQYMSQPKLCGSIESLKSGESIEVPLTAFFNEAVMSLTENITANARLIVEYRSLGSPKRAEIPLAVPVYHRNAMSWDDDRRAASFVSARDPAAMRFSRYVSSIVQNRLRPGINRNMQIAMGLFEALNLYGINYVIDPSSSYIELS